MMPAREECWQPIQKKKAGAGPSSTSKLTPGLSRHDSQRLHETAAQVARFRRRSCSYKQRTSIKQAKRPGTDGVQNHQVLNGPIRARLVQPIRLLGTRSATTILNASAANDVQRAVDTS
jgi:hypothetical protein